MLNVFALDPKIAQNLEQFRYCVEHCHPSRGRLIADLPPRSWVARTKEIIDQLDDLRPVEGARLKRWLAEVRSQVVDRPRTDWDFFESSWIKNTESEHQREPFSLITSPDYNEADDEKRKYPPSELYRTVSAWDTPSGISIERSPGEFVKAILPMLRLAKKIHLVDRFFNIDANSLYTQNYQHIIKDLAKYHNSSNSFPKELIIHCCPDRDRIPKRDYFENGLKKHYENLIPTGKSIKVFLWEAEHLIKGAHPLHNRYVLSNHCGVMVGYGTDSSTNETDSPDTLQIVDEKIYRDIWKIRDGKWPGACIKERFKISGI